MQAKLSYVIKFVSDMEKAIAFHRDTLGLAVRFATPEWSEFATGDVTLALHSASAKNAAGTVELGFSVPDLPAIYAERESEGLIFTSPPKDLHGTLLSTLIDCEGAEISLSGA